MARSPPTFLLEGRSVRDWARSQSEPIIAGGAYTPEIGADKDRSVNLAATASVTSPSADHERPAAWRTTIATTAPSRSSFAAAGKRNVSGCLSLRTTAYAFS